MLNSNEKRLEPIGVRSEEGYRRPFRGQNEVMKILTIASVTRFRPPLIPRTRATAEIIERPLAGSQVTVVPVALWCPAHH
jgi:hypothetical protein